jgi:hypothetical protein
VTAESPGADPLLLGSWPRSVWLEHVRRFYEAEGEELHRVELGMRWFA